MNKRIASVLAGVLFMLAVMPVAFAASTSASKQVNTSCAKTAVEKRENAIQTAWNTFDASMMSALKTRATALLAAWDIQDAKLRKEAIKNAWNTFKKSRNSAAAAVRTARLAAWKVFKSDSATCKVPPAEENAADDVALQISA